MHRTTLATTLGLVLFAVALPFAASGGAAPAAQEPATAAPAPPQRAVLVTGASTGIGRATTELLARNGFYVYAGARKEADLAELDAIENVQGIRLDVTKPEEIAAAERQIRDAGRGLYALINNAGVGVFAPLIELPESELDFQLDVNVYGPYRVTKAFAPLLIESGGRVATTGSISGTVSWALGGAYCMSKHAVEAFTDALALELEPLGVKVCVIAPGNYRSEISATAQQRLRASGFVLEESRYRAAMERMLSGPADRAQEKDPIEVAQAFLHALTAEAPKRRYLVVPNAREAEVTLRAAMARVAQLNADQPYAYDRDALVRMLDEALAAAERR